MRNDIQLNGFLITGKTSQFENDFFNSIFFTGNGRMGVRGNAAGDPQPRPIQRGFFIAGAYGEIKPGITDLINLPTPVWHQLQIAGKPGTLKDNIHYTLDLSCGLLTLQYALLAGNIEIQVTEERFFHPHRPALLSQRLQFTSNQDVAVELETGVLTASCNCPIPDDQVKENSETIQLALLTSQEETANGLVLRFITSGTQIAITESLSWQLPQNFTSEPLTIPSQASGILVRGQAKKGQPVSIEKQCAVFTSRDEDRLIAALPECANFESLLTECKAEWAILWQNCGILIEGDDQSQTALRYLTYQLLASCSARDSSVNIGARGLTHTRYKGCYFWDTDLFMMPFYLLTYPEAARSLETYRIRSLPQAKAHAKKMNSAGARYPWMASYDGSEQCETWDIGCSEVHITADVVYALDQYVRWTGDKAFEKKAREVYVETARFWKSRYSPAPEGGFNLLFCKGPDEYCGITNNNLYTNVLVQHNLDLAIKAAYSMQSEEGEQWQALGISKEEIQSWRDLRNGIKLPCDSATGHLRTDDTFHLLEKVDLSQLKTNAEASYHQVTFDRLQRYQVVKQADVLLLMTRMPELFTSEEKGWAWKDFEPLCLHDSTLSFASHAFFAAQNGHSKSAWDYFQRALFLDLNEIMGNTGKEGLHMAGMGEAWQTVVFGFAGLHLSENGFTFDPHLPTNWKTLTFHFFFQGIQYKAHITHKNVFWKQISSKAENC